MDLITVIIILAITGIAVGLASGLLGVGGCFIMVPVQFWLFQAMGILPDIAILLAFGTNCAANRCEQRSGAQQEGRGLVAGRHLSWNCERDWSSNRRYDRGASACQGADGFIWYSGSCRRHQDAHREAANDYESAKR